MRRTLTVVLLALTLSLGWDTLALGQAGFQGCHVNSTTPVVCRVGRGKFYGITINTKGASANYTYVFDSATLSGLPILVLDTTAGPVTVIYNMMMTNGVTVWNVSGTAADLTVMTE